MFKISVLYNVQTKNQANARSTLLKDNKKQNGPEQGIEWREFHDQGTRYILAEKELDEWQ